MQRPVDAASDRLRVALVDGGTIDPAVLSALQAIRGRAQAIAAQVDQALPLG
ncbi:MAG TPA: hypothetical protein VGR87_07485 [Candidatus Limnocylindria bacterium]|nr:hypothetical protein [Candidatus Limnocylindria bacterium]